MDTFTQNTDPAPQPCPSPSLRQRFTLGLGVVLLGGILSAPVAAQFGSNFHVLSNGADVIYGGLGAGGSSVGGVDGIGSWIDGNDLRGNQMTALGDYGYRQEGWFSSQCVLGAPSVGLAIKFPMILMIELDGRNANAQDVFTRPGCAPGSGGALGGLTSAGLLPYGTPPGSSASFLLSGLPSAQGLPGSPSFLLPNHGLLPTSNGGTATIIGAASAPGGLPIASTGFCWVISFGWLPSALVSVDHVDGWWHWLQNSPDDNQYWSISNDELNAFSSNTVATTAGATEVLNFFGNLEYEWHSKTVDPSLNTMLAPVGFQGAGPYYTSALIGPLGPNTGADMGRHGGLSLSGAGGALNPVTGLPAQDPGSSGAVPTLGFASWNNSSALTPTAGSMRTVWVQADFDGFAGLPPDAGTSIVVWPPTGMRLPADIPATPSLWPQPFSPPLLTLLTHDPVLQLGEPDPFGVTPGSVVPIWDATPQLPVAGLSGTNCFGFPLSLEAGSIGWIPGVGFDFDPSSNPVSHTISISILD